MAIMHEVALLRSRITELESANERLSKRRRLKQKRLQKGGSLSVEEAMALVGDNGGGSDLGDDIGGDSGGRQAAQPRIRRCGKCGETGHNARTCQADLGASSDNDSCNSN